MARPRWRAALATAVGGLLVGAWPAVATAQDTVAFRLTDTRITESSGLARDEAGQHYWTANDGRAQTAYGISSTGKVLGTLRYRAAPVDVEAVATHGDRLYLADIGDNQRSRRRVTVYFFDRPRATGLTVPYRSYDFTYPDGPHDAEALLVGDTGRLYVVTKGARGGIYAAPTNPTRRGANALTKVGTAPALVTDGVFLPGGTQVALLGYRSITVLDATTWATVATEAIPAQQQAESLAVSLDGTSLLVGSEGRRSTVYAVPVPAAATATPATADSTGSDAGADPAADQADDQTGLVPAEDRRGLLKSVGLAGVAAVVAGLVVALAHQEERVKPAAPRRARRGRFRDRWT